MLRTRRAHTLPHLAVIAAGCSLSLIASVGAASASTENPVTDALGFNLFVLDDIRFGSNEAEGAVAGGGNLSVASDYRVNIHANSQFTDQGQAVGMVIGGKIDWSAFGANAHVDVLDGTLKVGDSTGTIVTQPGVTTLVPSGPTTGSPMVTVAQHQDASTIFRPNLIDFASAFSTFRTLSDGYGACPETITPTDANGVPLVRPITTDEQAYLTLSPLSQNVLTLTPDELNHITSLTFRNPPTASGPLIINMDTSGTGGIADFSMPSLGGISGNNAPYILWNFPGATRVVIGGSRVLEGSVYAPTADLIDNMTNNIEGTVIAKSYDESGVVKTAGTGIQTRELHYFPFNTDLTTCEEAPTESPTTTGNHSPRPTPTPTTTTTPSPSHSTPHGTPTAPRPTPTGPHLPPTGASHSTLLASLAAVLTLGGTGLVLVTRRRRADRKH